MVQFSVCHKDKNCFEKHKTPIRIKTGELSLFKPIECKCPELFKIKCGRTCVKKKSVCKFLIAKNFESNETFKRRLKPCYKEDIRV